MNSQRIEQLLEMVRRDSGGAFLSGLAYIGDRLGLFRALAEIGPGDSHALSDSTGLDERYLREWLKAMVAFGYAEHDVAAGTYWLDREQRAVLVDESSPFFVAGTFQFTLPSLRHTDALLDCFRNGGGIPYDALGDEIPAAIDRMHRPWFEHLLTGKWLPAVPALHASLLRGISVLDIGCGLGRSTVAMARAYPESRILGVDPHAPSIAFAVELALEVPNARFEQRRLEELDATAPFDLIVAIDCIHDMRDPVGVLRRIRRLLAPGGLFFWSEPTGSADPLENRDSLARLRQALSLYHCLTVSLAEEGAGLGTLIGESGARQLAEQAGFGTFEVLPIDSPAQMFYGLRP